jgi:alcohol dehydrogenase
MDALTHAVEGYTTQPATMLSDVCAEKAMSLINEHLRSAFKDGESLTDRSGMLMASYFAGITLATASVGIVHGLAQTLGGEYSVPHGVANSLFLPYVMEFNRPSCREKYARIASLLGQSTEGLSDDDASKRAVRAVRRLSEDLSIPQRLRELNVPEDAIDVVAQRCLETQGRLVDINPRPATVEDLRGILREAY